MVTFTGPAFFSSSFRASTGEVVSTKLFESNFLLRKRQSATESGSSDTSRRSPQNLSRSAHKRDTVDLLKRGFAFAHRFERRLAQGAGAVPLRRVLQLPDRRAGDDELAQLVVEDQQLGDRLAAFEARPS